MQNFCYKIFIAEYGTNVKIFMQDTGPLGTNKYHIDTRHESILENKLHSWLTVAGDETGKQTYINRSNKLE